MEKFDVYSYKKFLNEHEGRQVFTAEEMLGLKKKLVEAVETHKIAPEFKHLKI